MTRMSSAKFALALIAATACAAPSTFAQETVMQSSLHDYRVVPVVDGLETPWSIAFLPGGDMLVTERPGRLRVVRDGRLLADPVEGVPEVVARGQGGLLDVVPHPDFANNRLLYISYSKPTPGRERGTTAVFRARFENDALHDHEEVFEANSDGNGHYGSRLAFDDEGYLYITVGDRQAPPRGDLMAHPAQDLTNHHGTVSRIHDDGRIPADNPFVDQNGAEPSIWSYGHRNQQGLVIHPETGDVWATEHGPQGGDELNHIRPGENYGWPVVGYGVHYRSGSAIHEATMMEGMADPDQVWVPSIATSGLMLYTGDKFPEWQGNLFVGGLGGEQIARLTLDGTDVVSEETLLHRMGRVRDVRQGPDGYIYVAIEDRSGNPTPIVRLEPVGR